jgi:hypothetical protein
MGMGRVECGAVLVRHAGRRGQVRTIPKYIPYDVAVLFAAVRFKELV